MDTQFPPSMWGLSLTSFIHKRQKHLAFNRQLTRLGFSSEEIGVV